MSHPIVFYDGVCVLCNRLTQFLLQRDQHDRLRFASLQSDFAAEVLQRHGADPKDLDTVYVVLNFKEPNEQLLAQSDAILELGKQIGGVWSVAVAGKAMPKSLRNWIYRQVARNRYRVFGKFESCLMPDPKYRHKFLDLPAAKNSASAV